MAKRRWQMETLLTRLLPTAYSPPLPRHSSQQLVTNPPLVDRGPFGAALMAIDQLGVVDAQAVEDRGVDVVDVQAVFDGVEADLVGPADHGAGLDAAAGHP